MTPCANGTDGSRLGRTQPLADRERTEARERALERSEGEVETSLTGNMFSTLPLVSASANLEVRPDAPRQLRRRSCHQECVLNVSMYVECIVLYSIVVR